MSPHGGCNTRRGNGGYVPRAAIGVEIRPCAGAERLDSAASVMKIRVTIPLNPFVDACLLISDISVFSPLALDWAGFYHGEDSSDHE